MKNIQKIQALHDLIDALIECEDYFDVVPHQFTAALNRAREEQSKAEAIEEEKALHAERERGWIS